MTDLTRDTIGWGLLIATLVIVCVGFILKLW
jgi:hypothetical protein